ncbi:MAG: hypothetical protein K6G55_00980 [Selenomonadaceae bacterium]|nr:hypothetical protein [Selenomonadaceae bacterium]
MDFAIIGTVSSYIKQKNLNFAAKYKIQTGQTITNANGNLSWTKPASTFDKLNEAAKTSKKQAIQQKLSSIKNKLKNGQKISDEELGFLRTNDTKTYKKAKHVIEAREELERELRQAKSKSEACDAMTRAMVKASASAMAELSALGQGGGGISGINAAMTAGVENSADVGNISAGSEISSGSNLFGNDNANISADTNVNVDGENTSANGDGKNQTLADVNENIQAIGERATSELSKIINAGEKIYGMKNFGRDTTTPEDIKEKYLWTVRALQDEWARFTDSDEYKDLPEHIVDEVIECKRQVSAPNRKAINAYRTASNFKI